MSRIELPRHRHPFDALYRPLFRDNNLSLRTNRKVYSAVIMGMLLYGAEAWVNKGVAMSKLMLTTKSSLSVTEAQQNIGYITFAEVRKQFGVGEVLEDVVVAYRLCLAGHVAHMNDSCLPKGSCLAGSLNRHPLMGLDLKHFEEDERNWFHAA